MYVNLTNSNRDRQIIDTVFTEAARNGQRLSAELIKVTDVEFTTWYVAVKPGQRPHIKSALGPLNRLSGAMATADQTAVLRRRASSR